MNGLLPWCNCYMKVILIIALEIVYYIFNSKVVFLISVWGGCENYLLDRVKILED